MRNHSIKLLSGIAALGLVVAACAESSGSSEPAPTVAGEADANASVDTTASVATSGDTTSDTTSGTDTGAGTTAGTAATGDTTAPGGGGDVSDTLQWALDFTGGTQGEATGDPLKIGYVNTEAVFPENTVGAQAALDFINTELGGFGGRPGELVPCAVGVGVPEDGTKCGTEMLNNDEVDFVLTGTLLDGNQQLYDVLDGKKPVVIGNAVANPDFLTTAGVGYATGSVGVIPGLAEYAISRLDPKPTNAAVIYGSNAAGQAAFNSLLKPVFDAAGIPVVGVEVSDPGATAADVQSAMVAAGADTADVFIPLVTVQSCVATYDAIQQLGIDPTVVTTGLCFGTGMTDHLAEIGVAGDVPDGWAFGGYGYSYFLPDLESGMETYLEKVKEYAKVPAGTTVEFTGFAGPEFGNVMALARFANDLGGDNITVEAMTDKIFNFEGPAMLQAGTLTCGTTALFGITFPAVCGNVMGVQRYVDGKWVSDGDALDGNPILVTEIGT